MNPRTSSAALQSGCSKAALLYRVIPNGMLGVASLLRLSELAGVSKLSAKVNNYTNERTKPIRIFVENVAIVY